MTAPAASNTEDKALSLLGSGVSAEQVASALGVTAARISQLLSDKSFADQVAELRFQNLQQHNSRDASYDSLEDDLIGKLKQHMSLLFRPTDILKAIQIVNGAKRRGQSAPDQVTNQQNIVNLLLPTMIKQKFVTNTVNQVVKAGDQELVTMQSGNLLSLSEAAQTAQAQTLQAQETQELTHEDINSPEALNL